MCGFMSKFTDVVSITRQEQQHVHSNRFYYHTNMTTQGIIAPTEYERYDVEI